MAPRRARRDHGRRCTRVRNQGLSWRDDAGHRRRAGNKAGQPLPFFPLEGDGLETVCAGSRGLLRTGQAIAEGQGEAAGKLEALVRSHTEPLIDRADYVRVFLNQRQFLPSTSRRKVGRWSRGLERLFEQVIAEGIREGSFRKGIDPRLATLALLGSLNAVPAWNVKEGRSVDEIALGLTKLALGGLLRR